MKKKHNFSLAGHIFHDNKHNLFSMHRIHFLVFQNLTWGVIPPVTGSVFWSLGMILCPGYPGSYTFHCLDNITSETFLNPSDSSTWHSTLKTTLWKWMTTGAEKPSSRKLPPQRWREKTCTSATHYCFSRDGFKLLTMVTKWPSHSVLRLWRPL